ncbi:Delta(5) fatty acid desaturase [Achlya hypogyna]|uniref:Delta(5) fatty acid desaturase n=1 Tax=Achlya hypogyna TaxID=1202772 RepID=A0A1V9ZN17_ACHHY|nr:Delta(5) fatty acid desaturase [Achlya hypogyna]
MAPQTELRQRVVAKTDVPVTAQKTFTWQEVAGHNTAASAWIIIRGKVYDVTEWANKHPGGREMVLLHAGREATDTFDSYHPFSDKAESILKKYEIGTFTGPTEFPTFKPDTGFYKECRKRVGEYFKKNKLHPQAGFAGLWRMTIVFAVAAVALYGMHFSSCFSVQLAAAALFGVCQALPLLHVMHDSSHASYTNVPFFHYVVGRFAMDWFAGGSMVSWLNQHVVGHHIYTNVAGSDPDLPVNMDGDVRRIVDRQVFKGMYAFQHLYLPPLYGVLGLKFRIQDFTETFGSHTNGPVRVNPHALSTWVAMICSKSFWAFYRIYLPLAVLQMPLKTYLAVFFLAEFVTGWYLAFNFQVSHVSTECGYPCGDEAKLALEDEWAVSQVKTSVDYAHGSWLTTFLAGALNYQVVHHLFPSVSQYHYPAIAPIVKEVCKEYGIKYAILPDFSTAFVAHLKHLRNMGKQGIPATIHMG